MKKILWDSLFPTILYHVVGGDHHDSIMATKDVTCLMQAVKTTRYMSTPSKSPSRC